MTRESRQLLAATVLGALLGGWSISGAGSMTFSIKEGTITAVHPGANTVEIGHRTCRLPANGAMGGMLNGHRTTINELQPGMRVHYAITGSAKRGCTVRMLSPARSARKE